MTIELTDAEQAAFLRLLDDYSQKLSCAGCNDFDLEATEENKALIVAAEKWNGIAEEDINLVPYRGKLITNDHTILLYLYSLVAGENDKEISL